MNLKNGPLSSLFNAFWPHSDIANQIHLIQANLSGGFDRSLARAVMGAPGFDSRLVTMCCRHYSPSGYQNKIEGMAVWNISNNLQGAPPFFLMNDPNKPLVFNAYQTLIIQVEWGWRASSVDRPLSSWFQGRGFEPRIGVKNNPVSNARDVEATHVSAVYEMSSSGARGSHLNLAICQPSEHWEALTTRRQPYE